MTIIGVKPKGAVVGLHVEITGFGSRALEALRRLIGAAKVDDPLAPVTVLVPNNIAGMVVRRHLARGLIDDHAGVAGIFLATLPRLAEQVAATELHPRTPATATVVASAWRSVLDDDPGVFEAVRNHPATISALTAAHHVLRDLSDDALDRVASAGRLHSCLIELHRKATARIHRSWYDQTDLLAAATTLISANRIREFGRLVLYLPQELTQAEVRFARTLASHGDLTVLAGLTGEVKADAAIRDVVTRLDGALPTLDRSRTAATPAPPTATQVIHASDSDDEVRRIVREVMSALDRTPAHRIAVLYCGTVPYARLLHEQLTAAGIPFNGRGTRPLSERAISRGLLGLLHLSEDLPRAELFRALSEAPVRTAAGAAIPVSRWERISRMAGVVKGPDWADRLGRYIRAEEAEIDAQLAGDAPPLGRIENARRQVQAAKDLQAFVFGLRQRLAEGAGLTTWSTLGAWATDLFHDFFGRDSELAKLPAQEQYPAAAIDRILAGLTSLDGFDVTADLSRLRDLLLLELEAGLPRVGRFGEGVFVGPVSAAVGLDADLVIVAGLAEDAYPGRMHEDALLGAAIRQRTNELPAATEHLDAQRRHLLAAFASGGRVIATFPRGDLRRSTHRLPTRWLLPTLRKLTGRPDLVAIDWDRYPCADVIGVRSHAAELLATSSPATEQEWRTKAVSARCGLDDPILHAATAMVHSRASDAFTRFDGNLTGMNDLPDFAAGVRRVSPTTLESYAICPHSFFIRRLLGIEPVAMPEELILISPLDIGNLIHESMDAFISECGESLPSYGQPWTDAHRDRLQDIAGTLARDYEERGATGHPLLWERERLTILAALDDMLIDDNQWRLDRDARVLASELSFGRDGREPVSIELPRGRVLMVGSADKIDQTRAGVLLVTDIKSGSARTYEAIGDDPVVAGTKLQLPVYAHAARQILGGAQVQAQYWFVRKNRGTRIPLALDATLETRYATTLSTLIDSIAAGYFPAKAPENPDFRWVQCEYCNPDGLGHGSVRERWERKRFDPTLEPLVMLIDPSAPAREEVSQP